MLRVSLAIVTLICLSSFACRFRKTKVFLVGDSTIATKQVKAYPEAGWGMPFSLFFDSTISVDNRAKNGRSTKSFMAEGLWQEVMKELSAGDYVFIQFGHNDEGKEKVGRYTTPEEFKVNLTQYINDARSKNALPVLITPVARRKFDSLGIVKESHPVYADAVIEVAATLKVPLIDLNARSKELLQQMGPEASKYLYNHLQPGEHPNYPDGLRDDTHFNELGARKIASIVLAEIRNLKLNLAQHIAQPFVKK